jgi:hypothetical protein
MTRVIETTVYTFEELPESVQAKVIHNNNDLNTIADWWSFDDFNNIAEKLGFAISNEGDDIFFSGFSSQGDGACFNASFTGNNNHAALITEYVPNDERLIGFGEYLDNAYNTLINGLVNQLVSNGVSSLVEEFTNRVTNEGFKGLHTYVVDNRYSHENTRKITGWMDDLCADFIDNEVYSGDCYNLIKDYIADVESVRYSLCKWLYKSLNDEYDYLTSDEAIREIIIANYYEFTIEGKMV